MLLITIGVVSLLFMFSFFIFDRDLLAPPTAVALVFLFGSFCCFYNANNWDLDFSPKSLGLITAGISATILGGILGVFISSGPTMNKYSFIYERYKPQEIYVGTIKTFIIIAFQLVTLVLLFMHITQLTGASDWVTAVVKYRVLTGRLADVNDVSIKMPIYTRNMVQFSMLLGVVYAYIIGNNLIATKKKMSLDWLPVILYTATTFMQGDRSNMIRLWVVVLITAYTVHRRKVGWKKNKETKKVIKYMMISVVAVGVIFVVFREFVGRESDMDPLAYVTFYAGSPIAVLNQVWDTPIVKPDIFGQRTLYYLNQSTSVLFGWPGKYSFYYPYFYTKGGAFIGNAPTAFRPAYVEFGFFGFFLIMMAFGCFFTFLYCICRRKRGNQPIDMFLLIYAFVAYTFLMYFYSTFFDFLSHVFIKYIIEFLIIRWILFGIKFTYDKKIIIRVTGGNI